LCTKSGSISFTSSAIKPISCLPSLIQSYSTGFNCKVLDNESSNETIFSLYLRAEVSFIVPATVNVEPSNVKFASALPFEASTDVNTLLSAELATAKLDIPVKLVPSPSNEPLIVPCD
jgi:hypothetical protein